MAPGTQAHTHDGQRQAPRDRPDIRAHLTGSSPSVDRRLLKETLFRTPARSPARTRLRRRVGLGARPVGRCPTWPRPTARLGVPRPDAMDPARPADAERRRDGPCAACRRRAQTRWTLRGLQTPSAKLRFAWLAPLDAGVKTRSAWLPVAVHIRP